MSTVDLKRTFYSPSITLACAQIAQSSIDEGAMKAKLSELASAAEIIASIGVVLSLLFVGLQLRDANRETRAATLRSAADTELYLAAEVANHPAGIPALSAVEAHRVISEWPGMPQSGGQWQWLSIGLRSCPLRGRYRGRDVWR